MERKDKKGRTLKTGESQRKDGMYQYRYTDLDNKRKTVYSWRLLRSDKTPSDKKHDFSLREKEAEIQEYLIKGLSSKGKYMSLNDMFDSYLLRKRHKGKPLLSNTKSNYKSMWDKNVRYTVVGNMKLANISRSDIVSLYSDLKEKDISYGTIVFFNKVMSSVLNMAIDDDIISKNPAKRALDEVEGEHKKRDALTTAQQEELLAFAKKNNRDMYRKLTVLIHTMCRISEFSGLTWEDIDMQEKIITIDHQLQYLKLEGDAKHTYHITQTKSKRSRIIPMTDEVYQILKELKRHYFILKQDYEIDGKENFLFYTSSNRLMNEGSFLHELKKFLDMYNQEAENKIEKLTPHILRHTGCTRNAENGMDIKVLQYIMGHSTSQITNDVYNHVHMQRARNEMVKAEFRQKNRA